jgi:hypothetical protein
MYGATRSRQDKYFLQKLRVAAILILPLKTWKVTTYGRDLPGFKRDNSSPTASCYRVKFHN